MPFRDAAAEIPPSPYGPSTPATAHHVFFGPVRSGKTAFCPKTVLPKPSGAAAPLPPSPAATTGGEA